MKVKANKKYILLQICFSLGIPCSLSISSLYVSITKSLFFVWDFFKIVFITPVINLTREITKTEVYPTILFYPEQKLSFEQYNDENVCQFNISLHSREYKDKRASLSLSLSFFHSSNFIMADVMLMMMVVIKRMLSSSF